MRIRWKGERVEVHNNKMGGGQLHILDKCESEQQGTVVGCSEEDYETLGSAIRRAEKQIASQKARRSV
jgi:hypothetical protein